MPASCTATFVSRLGDRGLLLAVSLHHVLPRQRLLHHAVHEGEALLQLAEAPARTCGDCGCDQAIKGSTVDAPRVDGRLRITS